MITVGARVRAATTTSLACHEADHAATTTLPEP